MRTLNVEPKMWFWVSICIFFIQVSDTQIYNSSGNTTYCYNSSSRPSLPDPFCVLCGCFETGLTEHTLSCGENEVIRMELDNDKQTIKSLPFSPESKKCNLTGGETDFCNSGFTNNATTTYTDRVEVYRNCTLQISCTITVKPMASSIFKVVRYPYVCESNIQDISISFSRRLSNPVFYFNGLDYISKTINCDCSVYKSSGNIEVEIFYLRGDNICNKFDLLSNTQLKNCTDLDVQLHTAPENIQTHSLKIEIRNMTVTGDEVVFFKVHGQELDVTCTGCITSSEPVSTSSKTTIPKPSSSTSSESTTTNQNSGHGSDQNIKAEYEDKLDEIYSMFGGIIAAIIIIVLLGIGIYCFFRKRRNFEKVKKEKQQTVPPQSNDGEYAHYVDLDLPNNTDTTNKQPETPKPQISGEESPKSNGQQIETSKKPKENENDSVVSPNLYFVIKPDARDESNTTSKTDAVQKLEESKSNELYSEPIKIKNQKPLTQERNGVNSTPTIASNTDDLLEDTYNHIGEPIVARNRVLSESHIKPIAKLIPIRYNHNPTDGVPTSVVTLNQNQPENLINPRVKLNPSADDYSHIQINKTQKVPKSIQSNYGHIDDRLVIMDSPVDREDTYSHIQDTPKVKTPQPSPRTQAKLPASAELPTADDFQSNYDHIDDRLVIMDSPVDRHDTYSHIQDTPKVKTPQPSPRTQDKLPASAELPTADDFYENVDLEQELKADNSVKASSLYNDEIEDTYDHLENTNIV